MPHRILQAVLPQPLSPESQAQLQEMRILSFWETPTTGERVVFNAVVDARDVEALSDWVKLRFSQEEEFRVNLLPLEATLPAAEEKPLVEEEIAPEAAAAPPPDSPPVPLRISRDELMADLVDATHVSRVYVLLAFISAMVAAGGILRDNTAIVIGAMVIAPLLGPNVALALSTTLADINLARNAMKANLLGVSVALIPSLVLGAVVEVNPGSDEIASRINVDMADIAIAVASGAAGVLAFTTGLSSTVIGVMVAVALMPPLVTFGLLTGSGQFRPAFGAFLLLAANVICVNLTGVLMFYLQGVRPASWWEARRAARATRISLGLWLVLLAVLISVILVSKR